MQKLVCDHSFHGTEFRPLRASPIHPPPRTAQGMSNVSSKTRGSILNLQRQRSLCNSVKSLPSSVSKRSRESHGAGKPALRFGKVPSVRSRSWKSSDRAKPLASEISMPRRKTGRRPLGSMVRASKCRTTSRHVISFKRTLRNWTRDAKLRFLS